MLNHYYPYAEAAFNRPRAEPRSPEVMAIAWPLFEQTGMFVDLDCQPFKACTRFRKRRVYHES